MSDFGTDLLSFRQISCLHIATWILTLYPPALMKSIDICTCCQPLIIDLVRSPLSVVRKWRGAVGVGPDASGVRALEEARVSTFFYVSK